MSLTDYLAKNYLNADSSTSKSTSKKRKRSYKSQPTGISINDDADAGGWISHAGGSGEAEDERGTIAGRTSEFRKTKKSNWTAVGAPAPSNNEQAEADAILSAAAQEQEARNAANDGEEAPQIVDEDGVGADEMSSGARAGLQSAAAVTAQMERKKAAERRRYEADPTSSGKGQETIYRDASGRIINVAMKRAEARKAAEDAEKKKQEQAELLKGDVQIAERERKRKEVQDAKYLSVARYADDADLNEELKEKDRWNDPAAQFLTKKKEGKSTSGKPLYKGSSAPNRYGIRPGYRWDGVDRSNGWEKEWFKKRNERQNMKDLSYQWQMDE